MTPKLALIFLVHLLLFGTVAGQVKSDRETADLIGSVKTVRERSYRFTGLVDNKKDDENSRKFDTGDTVTYDLKGNEIERVMVSDYGEAMGKQTQTFDASGRVKETIFVDPKGAVQEKSIYVYVESRLAEILSYDGAGVLREKTKRSYNSGGQLAEEVYFDPAVARAKTVYRYDANGNAVEMAFFLRNGQKAYAPVGPCLGAHRVTLAYDSKGRVVAKSVYETDGKVKKSWTYTFDDRGNFAEQTINSPSTTYRYSYKYEYDARGNWIKQTIIDEENGMFNATMKMLEAVNKEEAKKIPADEKQKLADSMKRTTVTTREISYF